LVKLAIKCDPKGSGQLLVKLTLKHLIGTLAVAVSARLAKKCQTRCITNSDNNQDHNYFTNNSGFALFHNFIVYLNYNGKTTVASIKIHSDGDLEHITRRLYDQGHLRLLLQ